jgi:hypothetical protein
MNSADQLQAQRPAVPTSVSLSAWGERVEAAQTSAIAEIETLTATLNRCLVSGTVDSIRHAESKLDAAKLNSTRLAAMLAAAQARIPELQATDEREIQALTAEKDAVNAETQAFHARVRAEWDAIVKALSGLLENERTLHARRSNFFQAQQRASELTRAAVSCALVPDMIFAPLGGAGTIAECVVALPALIDPAAPDAPRPRYWPPIPPVFATPPEEPRRPAPKDPRFHSWTVSEPGSAPPPPPPAAAPAPVYDLDPTYA